MNTPPIVLKFEEQLLAISPVLSDEMQHLISQLQLGFRSFADEINTLEEGWTDVAFNSANYSANGTGAFTLSATARPYVYRYKVLGKTMWFNFTISVVIAGALTSEIRVKIPGSLTPTGFAGLSGTNENMQRTAGLYSDSSGLAGVAGALVNVGGRYISMQRWDGAAGAVFTNLSTTVVGAMVQIPLV